MGNLDLYEKVRSVPDEAKKKISGGRLNGMTDISPMWRIKSLTSVFGACGMGWRYEIVRQWIEDGSDGTRCAFTNINLYVKQDGEWSFSIPGTGGSMIVSKERGGLYTDDEAFKKSLTDAIGVACKALGIGADVYWDKDASKYDTRRDDSGAEPKGENRAAQPPQPPLPSNQKPFAKPDASHKAQLVTLMNHYGWSKERVATVIKQASEMYDVPDKLVDELSDADFNRLLRGMSDLGEHEMADRMIANGNC